jgi:uroporphyrinogen decarboxylase
LIGASDTAMATIENPKLVHDVAEFSSRTIARYASALFDNGADIVMILEPTAVLLSPAQFEEFSGAYVSQIVQDLRGITILHICGDTKHLVGAMSRTGVDGLSLDSAVDFTATAQQIEKNCVLMGNLDPVRIVRNQSSEQMRRTTREFLEKTRGIPNLIVSSGCDLPQDTPIENIRVMIEETKAFPL